MSYTTTYIINLQNITVHHKQVIAQLITTDATQDQNGQLDVLIHPVHPVTPPVGDTPIPHISLT